MLFFLEKFIKIIKRNSRCSSKAFLLTMESERAGRYEVEKAQGGGARVFYKLEAWGTSPPISPQIGKH